jgi:hypothetical protein
MPDPIQDGVSNLKNVVTNLSNIGQTLQTAVGNLISVSGSAITLGPKTMASSIPVVIASNQTALAIATTAVNLTQVGGTAFGLGPQSSATSISVTLAPDMGPVTGTAFMARGSTTSSTTTAVQVLGTTGNATTRWYLTSLQFGNTGTVLTLATLNDSASSQFVIQGTSSQNISFPIVPLAFGLSSAITFALSTVSTSVVCNVQAFKGA